MDGCIFGHSKTQHSHCKRLQVRWRCVAVSGVPNQQARAIEVIQRRNIKWMRTAEMAGHGQKVAKIATDLSVARHNHTASLDQGSELLSRGRKVHLKRISSAIESTVEELRAANASADQGDAEKNESKAPYQTRRSRAVTTQAIQRNEQGQRL